MHSDTSDLQAQRHNLLVEKMRMDKMFTQFIDENELDPDDISTDDWTTYKDLLKQYDKINYDIRTIEYQLRRH